MYNHWKVGDVIEQISDVGGNGKSGDQFEVIKAVRLSWQTCDFEDYDYTVIRLSDNRKYNTNTLCSIYYRLLYNITDAELAIPITDAEPTVPITKENKMKLIFVKPEFKIVKFKFRDHIGLRAIEEQIEAGWSVDALGEKTEINSLVIKSTDKIGIIKMIRQYVFTTMGRGEAKNYVEQQIALGITEFEIRNFS